jgi:hypothetical protein
LKKAEEQLKRQLDNELEQIQFTTKQAVIKRVYPTSWKEKLHKLWNKEITIPLIPVSVTFVLLIVSLGYLELKPVERQVTETDERELIQVAGNYYWKDDLERVLMNNEN